MKPKSLKYKGTTYLKIILKRLILPKGYYIIKI